MEIIKIRDLEADKKTVTVVLVASIEEHETQTGSVYCRLALSDGESQILANLWNTSKEDLLKKVSEKALITAELYPKVYKGALGYELKRYSAAPAECRIEDFVIKAPMDSEKMFNEITTLVFRDVPEGNDGGTLATMVYNIYHKYYNNILYWSAAKSVHHNFYGGLLYHTLRMLRAAIMVSKVYPVDMELLFAGVALHDIGKLVELDTDSLGVADYSIDGNLFGHTLLGTQIIDDEARENPIYNPEKVKMLKHMLASHHGQLDWGAITLPAIPEAMMLHEIDMIDSRMMQFEDVYGKLEDGEMSDRIFGLGTSIYKPDYNGRGE